MWPAGCRQPGATVRHAYRASPLELPLHKIEGVETGEAAIRMRLRYLGSQAMELLR